MFSSTILFIMKTADLLQSANKLGDTISIGGLFGELDNIQKILDADRERLSAQLLAQKVHLVLVEAVELFDDVQDLAAARHVRHVNDLAERLIETELFHDVALRSGRDHQQFAAFRWQLLQEQFQRLQDEV